MKGTIQGLVNRLLGNLDARWDSAKVVTEGVIRAPIVNQQNVTTDVIMTVGVGQDQATVTIPVSHGLQYAEGEKYDVIRSKDPTLPNYTIGRRRYTTDHPVVIGNVNFTYPVLGTPTIIDNPTQAAGGGYTAKELIVFDVVSPGHYDLRKLHLPQAVIRYHRNDVESDWVKLAPQPYTPQEPVIYHLTSDLTAVAAGPAAVTLAQGDGVPTALGALHFRCGTEEFTAILTGGSLTGMIRGLYGTTAQSHPAGSDVILLSGIITLDGLPTGTPLLLQIACSGPTGLDTGPWSPASPLSFTTWEQPTPPSDLSSLTVRQMRAVIDVRWPRVTTDINAYYLHDLRGYNVVRTADPTTAAGWTPVGATGLSTGLPVAYSPLIDGHPDDDQGVVQVGQISWPATKGSGHWFGVRAIRTGGTAAVHWFWARDTRTPTVPSGVSYMSVPNGIEAQVNYSVDAAHLDDFFWRFLLYRSTSVDGSSGVSLVAAGGDQASVVNYVIHTLDSQAYYQLAAQSWAEEISPLSPTGWVYVASLYATTDWPLNGNFQDPDPAWPAPVVTWPGSATARPRYWTHNQDLSLPFAQIRYMANGGGEGNRAIRWDVAANLNTNVLGLLSTKQTVPSQKAIAVQLWVWSNLAISGTQQLSIGGAIEQWTTDDGTGTLFSGYNFHSADITLLATTWTRVDITGLPALVLTPGLGQGGVARMYFGWFTRFAGASTNPALITYIDSVRVIFS